VKWQDQSIQGNGSAEKKKGWKTKENWTDTVVMQHLEIFTRVDKKMTSY